MSTQGTWALWASWFIGETWETVKNLYRPLMFCQKAIEKTQPESGVWGRGEHTAQRRAGSLLVLSWQARWTLEDSGGSCAVGAVATGMKLGAARCLHFHVVWFPRHDGCYLLQCANHFGMCKEGCGQSERCCSREKNTYFINIRTFSWCMCYRKWFWDVLSPGLFFLLPDASAKRQGYTEGFNTAFRGGSVMGYALCSLGVLVLWILLTVYRKARVLRVAEKRRHDKE